MTRIAVVETDTEVHIGEVLINEDGDIVVRNGFTGRNPFISAEEVESITPVSEHPDVVALSEDEYAPVVRTGTDVPTGLDNSPRASALAA